MNNIMPVSIKIQKHFKNTKVKYRKCLHFRGNGSRKDEPKKKSFNSVI